MKHGSEGKHLILYDGLCGLCNRLNRFVLPRDHTGQFQFAALQSALGRSLLQRYGKDPDDLDTFCVVENYDSQSPALLSKALAGLFVLETLGGPWRASRALRILPRPLLDRAYDFVARHRYRLFGRYETCLVPSPEYKSRFIET